MWSTNEKKNENVSDGWGADNSTDDEESLIEEVTCHNCGFQLKINTVETCPEDIEEVVCCCDDPDYTQQDNAHERLYARF